MEPRSLREVWFIRHAESVANAGGRTREAPSYPLSELGFRQAEQLAPRLPADPQLIILSPYLRARQTAAPFQRRMTGAVAEEWPVQEVQYLDPVQCVDTTQDERRALSLAYWERADACEAPPGAESFVTFIRRAEDALDRLTTREEQRTYVFCHGQFMSAIAWLILTRPASIDGGAMRRFYQFVHAFIVPNCSILPVYFHGSGCSAGGLIQFPEVERTPSAAAPAGLQGL